MTRPFLVTAGLILCGDGKALEDAAVAVERGRIAWVGRAGEADRVIHGETEHFSDGCLVPGLIDAHVHLCFEHGADLSSQQADVPDIALSCRRLLAAGVTSVRDLGSPGCAVQRARDAIRCGQLDGPRILCSGRPITTADGHLRSFGVHASGEVAVAAAVSSVARDGADTVKIVATGGAGTPGTPLGRAQYTTEELRAAVCAAQNLGLPVAAHAHGTEGIARAVAAGVHTVEHCSWMDPAGGVGPADTAVLVQMRRGRQIAVTAGPLPQALVGQTALPTSPPAAAQRTLAIWSGARKIREHGVTQALGTDAMFGQFDDYHDLAWRAQALVEMAGWPEEHVLDALWRGGAAALSAPGILGIIAPGAHADLVVLGNDPRSRIRALHDIRAVYRAGHRTT